jgi:hypothetical protein
VSLEKITDVVSWNVGSRVDSDQGGAMTTSGERGQVNLYLPYLDRQNLGLSPCSSSSDFCLCIRQDHLVTTVPPQLACASARDGAGPSGWETGGGGRQDPIARGQPSVEGRGENKDSNGWETYLSRSVP